MSDKTIHRSKIINDPIYGFIHLPAGLLLDIIQDPVFQRLRRIRQLGMANLVYHGAEHTRFQHAIGAFHLMTWALNLLADKGIGITEEEKEAAQIAILLHDIGHGPFSHSLEGTILPFHHEQITLALLHHLNRKFSGRLRMAIDIFNGSHPKPFLHELVTSQLDMDRMDYLNRDRFFTGVSEGVIGYDRIINMLNVVDGHLVVEEKGIYSLEKFLVARRLMYWQVYLHKTSLAAEAMLRKILKRGKELISGGEAGSYIPTSFRRILQMNWQEGDSISEEILELFIDLDDHDIISSIKEWRSHSDEILSYLSESLYYRRLYKTRIGTRQEIEELGREVKAALRLQGRWSDEIIDELVHMDVAENSAYKTSLKNILILYKDGRVEDISKAAENLDIRALAETVTKHYISYPRI
jgi:HD superfamily phosphohydrolase